MKRTLLHAVWAGLAILTLVACQPKDRRPGLWLSGDVETAPVSDWSFVGEHREIFVETRTWYGIPHSVTTVVVAHNGTLYVPSVYFEGGEFPEARFWNRNVARDPRVRLKIGERIFERRAVLVEDEAEWKGVFAAFAQKMPFWSELAAKPETERPTIIFLRMDPREGAV
jgi:hypothetical protein